MADHADTIPAGAATAGVPAGRGDAERPGVPRLARGDRNVIGLLLVAAFVVILNETIMGVALPVLQEDLGITAATGQWLTTGFLLTMAIVIPITGFLIKRFPTRGLFITAMSLFSLGTLVAFLAPGFEVLLLGRIIQASGTAVMMPLLITTVLTLVPPQIRGRMMGNISIVISVAPAIGPTVSGIIIQALDWRWMFGVVLPIAIAALVLGVKWVRNVGETTHSTIDVLSVVLSAVGFGGIVFGLSSFGESATGGVSAVPFVALGVGAVALVAFILRQVALQKEDRALLDLRTFRSRTFSVAVVMMGVGFGMMIGTFTVLPFFLSDSLRLESLTIGLLLLPGGLLQGLLAPFIGRMYDRVGPRPLLVPGTVLISVALWTFASLTSESPAFMVLVAHLLLSAGLAFMFTPLFTAGLGSVEPRLYSYGSAMVSTTQQVAAAAGTALLITVYSIAMAGAGGHEDPVAVAVGTQTAFTVGASVSLLLIVLAFFVKPTPVREGQEAPVAH